MTPERIRSVLQKIADGAPRGDFHGHALNSMERRGWVRCEFFRDPVTKTIMSVKYHLTPEGQTELDRLAVKPSYTLDGLLAGMTEENLRGEVRPDTAVGNEFPNGEPETP
jgi:hypothetical protein